MQPDTNDCQTPLQKALCTVIGAGGISLHFVDIATFFQQIGMIVGGLLVCAQAYDYVRKKLKNGKKPANDA